MVRVRKHRRRGTKGVRKHTRSKAEKTIVVDLSDANSIKKAERLKTRYENKGLSVTNTKMIGYDKFRLYFGIPDKQKEAKREKWAKEMMAEHRRWNKALRKYKR